jgi:hypothetical protein
LNDHLARMLGTIAAAATHSGSTEAEVLHASQIVEASATAMEGDIPECVRTLVASFARDLETLAFTVDETDMSSQVAMAHSAFRTALEACLAD